MDLMINRFRLQQVTRTIQKVKYFADI